MHQQSKGTYEAALAQYWCSTPDSGASHGDLRLRADATADRNGHSSDPSAAKHQQEVEVHQPPPDMTRAAASQAATAHRGRHQAGGGSLCPTRIRISTSLTAWTHHLPPAEPSLLSPPLRSPYNSAHPLGIFLFRQIQRKHAENPTQEAHTPIRGTIQSPVLYSSPWVPATEEMTAPRRRRRSPSC